MKRFATTLLMAMAAAGGALCATVRMGALSTDTTVETLGEGAAAVQLVSKAKIDSMIEALSVGSDGAWLELNGSTGLIYQVVREVGYEGGNDKLIVTGVSEDFSGYMIPSNPVGITFTLTGNLSTYDFYGIDANSIYGVRIYKTGLQVSMIGQGNPLFSWNALSDDPMVAPFLLSGSSAASHGSITLDWYGIKTNAYQVALVDDIPDMSGYATTGAVAAVAATIPDVAASTNWLARTGLSGSVAFDNASGRPQAWTGTGALTVSGFTGLNPPVQVYWTLAGFDSVTLPAGVHVVGGGSWQTNMVNHFTLWQTGTNVLMSYITATED